MGGELLRAPGEPSEPLPVARGGEVGIEFGNPVEAAKVIRDRVGGRAPAQTDPAVDPGKDVITREDHAGRLFDEAEVPAGVARRPVSNDSTSGDGQRLAVDEPEARLRQR